MKENLGKSLKSVEFFSKQCRDEAINLYTFLCENPDLDDELQNRLSLYLDYLMDMEQDLLLTKYWLEDKVSVMDGLTKLREV